MILTNEQVAELLERERVPAIYRVHAQPDPTRIERLLEQLAALGRADAAAGAGALGAAGRAGRRRREPAGRPRGRAARTRPRGVYLARAPLPQTGRLQRANSGHAGLGSDAYTHFTSPIRRYPDLVVHRALLAALGEGEEAPRLAEAREVAADSSARERESAKIERDADDVCAAYLLERELGERGLDADFEGEVSGVIRAGAFVAFGGELGDVYEGMLPARRLPGGRYELDRAEVALVGRGSRRRCGSATRSGSGSAGVDAARGRVDLELRRGG